VKTDDLLKESPQLAPYRPKTAIGPKLAGAELVTLAVMQALMGFTSEARWLRYARAHLCHLFPWAQCSVGMSIPGRRSPCGPRAPRSRSAPRR
jgi:hypothetical protein